MKQRRLFLALPIALAACGGPGVLANKWTTEVVEEKEVGAKPVAYEAAIREYLNNTLKDPFSAQIQKITAPVEGRHTVTEVLQTPTLLNVNGRMREIRTYGWLVVAEVNAKNSYGGYTGWHLYQFIFRGEKIIFSEDVTAEEEKRKQTVDRYLRR